MKKQEIEKLVEMQAKLERLQYIQNKMQAEMVQEFKIVPRSNGYAVTEFNSKEIAGLSDGIMAVVCTALEEEIGYLSAEINDLTLCKGEDVLPVYQPVDIIKS